MLQRACFLLFAFALTAAAQAPKPQYPPTHWPIKRSTRNVVFETPAAAGVVESVNRRFKDLWENRSLVFPQIRQFPQRFSRPKLGLRC